MIDYEKEKEWWNKKAVSEEIDTADEKLNRELRWRVINRYLADTKTIAEIGAGTGQRGQVYNRRKMFALMKMLRISHEELDTLIYLDD